MNFDDAIYLSLYYLKRVGVNFISSEQVQSFFNVIQYNLKIAGCNMSSTFEIFEKPFYSVLKDEAGKTYFTFRSDIEFEAVQQMCIGSLPLEIVLASELPNALGVLGLVLNAGQLKLNDSFLEKNETSRIMLWEALESFGNKRNRTIFLKEKVL